jgi:hypothetical protein
MTAGQLAYLSWFQAHIWGPRSDFCYCRTVVGLLMWGTLSKERTGLSYTMAAGPRQCSHSHGTHDHILLFKIQDSPNLEGQVPIFISPRNRVAQSCPLALVSLFISSYDSQGYSGGIRTRLHTGSSLNPLKRELLVHYIRNSPHTSQETYYISATKPNRLMLFRETFAVYCENHKEQILSVDRMHISSMLK